MLVQTKKITPTHKSNTHCALVLDAVQPEITGGEFLPNYQGRPREQHLSGAQHPSVGVIEGEGAIDDIIGTYLGHQVDSLLEAVVPHVLDVASLGQTSRARSVDITSLVCVPKKNI